MPFDPEVPQPAPEAQQPFDVALKELVKALRQAIQWLGG